MDRKEIRTHRKRVPKKFGTRFCFIYIRPAPLGSGFFASKVATPVMNPYTTIDQSLYKPKAEGYNLKQAGAAILPLLSILSCNQNLCCNAFAAGTVIRQYVIHSTCNLLATQVAAIPGIHATI